jgi:hypothetical protein
MSNDDEKILHVFGTSETSKLNTKAAEFCQNGCVRVVVDEADRKLECRDCGRIIEPFDYLWKTAKRRENVVHDLESLKSEVRLKRGELEKIKAEIQNERAKLRRIAPENDLSLSVTAKWQRQHRSVIGKPLNP